MPAITPEIPEFYIQPGEYRLVRVPSVLKTVLGSCLGITFHAPRIGASALCHPMLPHRGSRPRSGAHPAADRRYVDSVIWELAAQFDRLGAQRDEVEIKLFGGADVLVAVRPGATVGKLNAEMAMRVLREEGFTVRNSKLGGRGGVFIEFHTGTGEVRLRRLARTDVSELLQT
jgi:chemotaxis protein CheD